MRTYKILIIFTSILYLLGCSMNSDPFNDSNLLRMYIDFAKSGGMICSFSHDPKLITFLYDNIIEFKDFKVIKQNDTDKDTHIVEFTCNHVSRINSKDIDSKFSYNELKNVFGENYLKKVADLKAENLKIGDVIRTIHLQMTLKKFDNKWDVNKVLCY